MNFMRSKAGFTLVELIVVIAILGILAGIAIPAYGGYIKKANEAADMQVLTSVKTAIDASYATSTLPEYIEINDAANDTITVGANASTDAAIPTEKMKEFNLYYIGDDTATTFSIALKSGSKAVWSNGAWDISGDAYTGS